MILSSTYADAGCYWNVPVSNYFYQYQRDLLQAWLNQTVDIVLTLISISRGGCRGAIWAKMGEKLRRSKPVFCFLLLSLLYVGSLLLA